MSEKRSENVAPKDDTKGNDVLGNLSLFIEKKKTQNEALKKIVNKFSATETNKKNK